MAPDPVNPAAEPEQKLVERARAGDRAAFGELVLLHRGKVYHFARRLLGDATQAEDVMQETFLAAHASLASFRGEGSVRGWLLSIARTRAAMLRRRRAGEPGTFESMDSLEELGAKAGWGHPLNPEELTSRVEQHAVLEKALAALPEAEREIVLMRDVEGLSGEETCAALGLSLAAMKSRLHRARLQLLAQVKAGGQS